MNCAQTAPDDATNLRQLSFNVSLTGCKPTRLRSGYSFCFQKEMLVVRALHCPSLSTFLDSIFELTPSDEIQKFAYCQRTRNLASLAPVDAVFILPEKVATNFLRCRNPTGRLNIRHLNQEERQTDENAGCRNASIPFVPEKFTSRLIKKILSI